VPPLLVYSSNTGKTISSQVRRPLQCRLDTLGFDNGALSVKTYTNNLAVSFGLQLPSPFSFCAGIGLPPYPDSLGPALKRTTLVRSLFLWKNSNSFVMNCQVHSSNFTGFHRTLIRLCLQDFSIWSSSPQTSYRIANSPYLTIPWYHGTLVHKTIVYTMSSCLEVW